MNRQYAQLLAWFPIGLLCACTEVPLDVGNEGATSSGGSSNATGAGGSANPVSGEGGAISSTVGGAATTPPNPNRNLTPAELDAIEAVACIDWAVEPEPIPTKLELVVDVSSSMNVAAPGTIQSKWEVTRDALIEAVPGLAGAGGLAPNVAVGLMFYPNMINNVVSSTPVDPSVCINTTGEVGMSPLGSEEPGSHRSLLRQKLTEVILGPGTPTQDAYDHVLYNTVLSPQQQNIPGDAHILLITDGMPTLYKNCYNPAGQLQNLPGDSVVAAVSAAYDVGVKTFVVGSPGSEEGRAWLSQAAFWGGTARPGCNPNSAEGPYCHMDMTTAPNFSDALRAGLGQVMTTLRGCKIEIPSSSTDGVDLFDAEQITPIIVHGDGTAVLVGKDTTSGTSCENGYRILSGAQLELCQTTCSELMTDPMASLRLYFGCTTDEISEGLL